MGYKVQIFQVFDYPKAAGAFADICMPTEVKRLRKFLA